MLNFNFKKYSQIPQKNLHGIHSPRQTNVWKNRKIFISMSIRFLEKRIKNPLNAL